MTGVLISETEFEKLLYRNAFLKHVIASETERPFQFSHNYFPEPEFWAHNFPLNSQQHVMTEAWTLEPGGWGCICSLYPSQLRSLEKVLISLCFGFLICKGGIMIPIFAGLL